MRRMTTEAFWNRVRRGADAACWEWSGYRDAHGYGKGRWSGALYSAHRKAWELTRGAIPDGLCVCHQCDNPACCNPAHLFLGTHQDNMRDRNNKGRTARQCGLRNGRYGNPFGSLRGEEHGRAKLNAHAVLAIRELAKEPGMTRAWIGALFGISRTHVRRIVSGEQWAHASTSTS